MTMACLGTQLRCPCYEGEAWWGRKWAILGKVRSSQQQVSWVELEVEEGVSTFASECQEFKLAQRDRRKDADAVAKGQSEPPKMCVFRFGRGRKKEQSCGGGTVACLKRGTGKTGEKECVISPN